MRYITLAVAALAAAVLAGCASAPSAATRHPAARLSALQVCQQLRADMLRNGGQPDRPAVRRLAGQHAASGRSVPAVLAGDLARYLAAMPDPGEAKFALSAVAGDCTRVQVTLPAS